MERIFDLSTNLCFIPVTQCKFFIPGFTESDKEV